MTYQDLIAQQTDNVRVMRLAWNTANTNVIDAIAGIAFREINNGNSAKAQILIDLVAELHPVLQYK
jgi:hypothetical protein